MIEKNNNFKNNTWIVKYSKILLKEIDKIFWRNIFMVSIIKQ